MDLNQHRGKLLASGAAALLAIGVLAGILIGQMTGPAPTVLKEARNVQERQPTPEEVAASAVANCDDLASEPFDPNRSSAPVPDDRFAPGQAIPACLEAARLNPESGRAWFQLGRSYWLARRDGDAFAAFVESADRRYPAAMKYIGDAFYLNRGLPPDQTANAETALSWYRMASEGGYGGATEAIAVAEEAIRKNRFDGSRFQNANFMRAIYENRLEDVRSPFALAYYIQGIAGRLNHENTVFMDEACKPLLNVIGNTVIQYGQLIAMAKTIADVKNSDDAAPVIDAGLSYMFQKVLIDQGDRDAIVLFDGDVYGCDSAVTKQIVGNIMVRVNNAPAART